MSHPFSIEKRPYQIADVNKILAEIERAKKGVVYQGPTGSGKSVVLGLLSQVIVQQQRTITLLTHRRELIGQLAEKVAALQLPFGFIKPGHRPGNFPIHIGSIDTVAARLHMLRPFLESQWAIAYDEAHHLASPRWSGIWGASGDAHVIGASATPWRLDGAGLGAYFDVSVHGPSIRFLIDHGWLSEPIVYQPPIPIDLKGVKTIGGDWNIGQLAKVMDDDLITEKVIKYWMDKARGRPTLVFCVTVEHAHNVAALWRKLTGLNAVAVDGYMDDEERDAALNGLKDGSVDVVTACELVSEGLDVPRVACGVFLRPSKSTGLVMQQGGRVMRLDDEFDDALIIDPVANITQHGMLDEPRPWSLKSGAKGMERDVRKPIRCIECFRVQPATVECIECGRRMVTLDIRGTATTVMPLPDNRNLRGMSREMLKLASEDSLLRLAATENDLKFIAHVTGRSVTWIVRNIERLRRAQLEYQR